LAHVQSSKHRESEGCVRGSVSWSQEPVSGDGMVMYICYITIHINGICSALVCDLCVIVRVKHCNYTHDILFFLSTSAVLLNSETKPYNNS